jgi:hypothetical protein
MGAPSGTQLRLALYDAAGHCLRTYPIAPDRTGYDASALGSGIYMSMVEGDRLRSALRFVKE